MPSLVTPGVQQHEAVDAAAVDRKFHECRGCPPTLRRRPFLVSSTSGASLATSTRGGGLTDRQRDAASRRSDRLAGFETLGVVRGANPAAVTVTLNSPTPGSAQERRTRRRPNSRSRCARCLASRLRSRPSRQARRRPKRSRTDPGNPEPTPAADCANARAATGEHAKSEAIAFRIVQWNLPKRSRLGIAAR